MTADQVNQIAAALAEMFNSAIVPIQTCNGWVKTVRREAAPEDFVDLLKRGLSA